VARGRPAAALSALLTLWLATACTSPTWPFDARNGRPQAAVAGTATRHGFLWDARKGERHALLMGTLHVGEASDYPPDRPTRQRLAAVDVVALEADVSKANGADAALRGRALLAAGEPGLDTRIEAPLRSDAQRAMQRVGLPAERAWRMKPWMLGDTLVLMQAAKLGFSPSYSTESYLVSFAAAGGKPIAELEGVRAQYELLDAQPWSDQVDGLRQVVGSILDGEAEEELRTLVAAWRASDAAAMQQYLRRVRNSSDRVERRQFERLIAERNATMAETIDHLLQDGRFYLVAVGSLHFFGDDSLIHALRARGYSVTPLVPEND
jgi:uncharacterized protein